MNSLFDVLCGEPDIPANIFVQLPPEDVCQVELVCKHWKSIVGQCHIWKKKLEHCFYTKEEWKILLIQYNWDPDVILEHKKHKWLFMKISSLLGPDEMTVGLQRYITNDTLIDANTPLVNVAHHKCPWDEEIFLAQRHNDHISLMSKMPKQSRARGMPWQKTVPRKTTLSHDGEHYSNLILFSPTAFPILVTSNNTSKRYVAAAGARYGKGKLVVLPHEAVLCHGGLIQGAIDWCSNKTNSPVYMDPLTKGWTQRGWEYKDVRRTRRDPPFPVTYLARSNITEDIPVYITEGHYEDSSDTLMEYVKNGGGLIIGGHAWWWAMNDQDVVGGRKCTILEHPGNKIIARAGIAFSREGIQQNNIEFVIDNIPALQYSLYYALKTCLLRPSYIFRQDIFDKLLKGSEYEDIQLFSDQLINNDCFKIILKYMYEIQKRPF